MVGSWDQFDHWSLPSRGEVPFYRSLRTRQVCFDEEDQLGFPTAAGWRTSSKLTSHTLVFAHPFSRSVQTGSGWSDQGGGTVQPYPCFRAAPAGAPQSAGADVKIGGLSAGARA